MLTIVHSPIKYDFSRNPNYVEITTNNMMVTTNLGLKASCYFSGLFACVTNDTLSINVGTTTYTFTFKPTENLPFFELKEITTETSDEYMIYLANALMHVPAIYTFLKVFPDFTALRIEAINGGTAYNFSTSGTDVTGAAFYKTDGTDNVQTVTRPNYKIQLTLFGKNGVSWDQIVSFSKTPVDNKIRCDLQEYIDKYLSYDLPEFGNWISFECTNCIKEFYVKIEELYGDPPTAHATSFSPGGIMSNGTDTIPYKVLKAGYDTTSSKIVSDTQFNRYIIFSSFLTRQNRKKKISRNQIEYLYYIFPINLLSNAAILTKYYNAIGELVNTTVTLATTPGVQQFDVWAFPITRPFSTFALNEDYVKMEVFVRDNSSGDPLSETFTYILDEEASLEDSFLYHCNSDAGLDTVRCKGVRETSGEYDREFSARTLTINDTLFDGDSELNFAEKVNKWAVHSGWVIKSELTYVEELLLSKKVFMYGNEYGQQIPIPVIITNKSLQRNRTNQNLYGYVIEFEEAIKSQISQANYIPIV